MYRFIVRRLASGVVLIAILTTLTFFLLYLSGGDIARRIVGEGATEEAVQAKAHELGLDRSVWSQFTDWLSHAVSGDLGSSWFNGQPVSDAISSRLSVTLSLVIGATLLTAVLATVLGVVAATRGGWVDRVVQFLGVLGHAIPNFLIAIGLVSLLAVQWHWFDATGYTEFADSPSRWLSSITLPVLALVTGAVSSVAQQVRGAVIDALRQDYVRTLRSRGLSETRVIYRHVLRNAAGPALSYLGVQFVGLIGGAVIIEQIFAIPGLGQVAVGATSQGDIPLVMGLVMVTAVIVVVLNLLVDLAQGWLNPKVRHA
ncbi:ABC transporter permease [Streptomyces blattellae]|uniref:ABC transporter permease n=1 Tax=Streptomyces blattellae TaxID=2569855 RepID=UPI0012B6FA06|nr:ABC transporter permease [Streptomyces blattellae]